MDLVLQQHRQQLLLQSIKIKEEMLFFNKDETMEQSYGKVECTAWKDTI